MGQYYKPTLLTEDGKPESWVYTHDYNNGLKLMEHSYIGNQVTARIEAELLNNPRRLVWAGDYADNEPGVMIKNDDDGEDAEVNIYRMTDSLPKLSKDTPAVVNARYIVNHDKKQFVDKNKVTEGEYQLKIHPMPLLTAEGNGQGGGDYRGNDTFVGTWSRDHISVRNDLNGLDDFTELEPNFAE